MRDKLVVRHLSDYYGDCEQCGGGAGAEGYAVTRNGEEIVRLTPIDSFYNPTTFNEMDLLYAVLKAYRHEVEIEEVDEED